MKEVLEHVDNISDIQARMQHFASMVENRLISHENKIQKLTHEVFASLHQLLELQRKSNLIVANLKAIKESLHVLQNSSSFVKFNDDLIERLRTMMKDSAFANKALIAKDRDHVD